MDSFAGWKKAGENQRWKFAPCLPLIAYNGYMTSPTRTCWVLSSISVACLSLGCTPEIPTKPPHPPLLHRASPATCSMTRPAGVTMSGGGMSQCTSDADCKDSSKGQNGRCVPSRIGTICSYDTCFDDSVCGGKVCECRAAATSASLATNHCLSEGNCRTDADCGTGGACSPSFGSCGSYSGVVAYYCHTSRDTCVDDAECATSGGFPGYCAYNPAAGIWQCSTSLCAG